MIRRPLAIDLFCGLFGWAEGLTVEGFDVIGFDLEDMCGQFRMKRPDHAQLVIQDVRTLHGSQFRTADLIVCSPPCQEFSYMAMPWSKAKAKRAAILADETGEARATLTELFDACFRIQREACEAAGRHIPMIVENVRGANEWVGRSRWNYGSFHFWGDVPALMPPTGATGRKVPGFRFDGSGKSFQSASVEGTKQHGDWFAEARKGGEGGTSASFGSKYPQRKMASAMIAKIPFPLSRHLARVFKPPSDISAEAQRKNDEPGNRTSATQ